MQRGALIEEQAQVKLELLNEKDFYKNFLLRKKRAVMGIVLDVLVTIIFLGLVLLSAFGFMGVIVTPVLIVFWVIWAALTGKRVSSDFKLLIHAKQEEMDSLKRQVRLQGKMEELDAELAKNPQKRWFG